MADALITVKLTGLNDFEKMIRELPDVIQKQVVLGAFRDGATVLQERAVQLAPGRLHGAATKSFNKVSGGTKPETVGKTHLWESIKVIRPSVKRLMGNSEIIYTVRARHPLAFLAEYGSGQRTRKSGGSTGSMPAFAFLRRAVDEKGTAVVSIIASSAKSRLEKALAKYKKGK